MRIALDAMGGDFAPDSIVQGAILASQNLPEDAEIVLIGQEEVVRECLQKHRSTSSRISIVAASQVIQMGEHPTKALTQKPDSSISKGYQLLKSKEIDAFCSAGNTGAMLVGAMFSVKAVEGVLRPAIVGYVPKVNGSTGIFLDVGANAECKPEVLEQFGELGSIYAANVLGITSPKIGLMNLGEEEGKGTVILQAAHQLLKNNKRLNFIGNIEGRDLFNDKADVIACDGFIGNVILKLSESIYDILLSKNIADPYFDKFNYEAVGGSPILGINGNAIIGHGVSSPTATCNMLHLAYQMAKSGITEQIQKTFSA